jgi:ABC-2 type transport system permease protein
VSLDLQNVTVSVVVESPTPEAADLAAAYRNSRYFTVKIARHRAEVEDDLVAGRSSGIIVIAEDFAERLGRGEQAPVQVIVDGSDPNTAGLVQGYAQGVWRNWLEQAAASKTSLADRPDARPLLSVEPRYWFNPELSSRESLLPGSVAIVLTIIGTLLTALVIAREWERGTMEALLATPVQRMELLAGKIVPYFALGMAAMGIAVGASVLVFGVPFRGSVFALVVVSTAFLMTMLTLGLLISTKTRNQFVACQAALIVGFLPAFELSGFIFEIDSMPAPIRLLTRVLPPRYFVSSLQTLFLAGDVPAVLVPNTLVLAGFAIVLMALLVRATPMRLEG